VASFGVRLKQEREQRGMTLEEISSTTKIGTRMLVALEQDHFDQLPGGIFNKGFIRAYARCVGLDEEQAIADYLVASGAVASEKEKDKKSDGNPEPTFDLRADSERRESSLPWGTFALLLLLLALGFAVWGFYFRNPGTKHNRKTATPETTQLPSTAAPPAKQVAATPVSTTPVSTPTPAPPPPVVPKSFSLRIILHGDSWLSITSDGHPILQGSSFSAPTEKTIRATKEIVVKAGNVGALDFEFNGKPLPAQGADNEVKTLTFDATGLRSSAPPSATTPQP
jgi:cytoskeleton protein RodZ